MAALQKLDFAATAGDALAAVRPLRSWLTAAFVAPLLPVGGS